MATTRREFLEYLAKADSEGGTTSFLRWGGVERFPEELRPHAAALDAALEALGAEVDALAEHFGIDVNSWWDEPEMEDF